MAELKTKQNDADVEKFLAGISDDAQREDSRMLCRLMSEATRQPPKMWGKSIIGFGTYRYKYASGREGEWMLTGFSPRKASLTLYIMSGFDDYAAASGYDPSGLLQKLGPHSLGKSCLYIKRLSDIDKGVLKQLIAESVEQMKSLPDRER